MLSRNGQHKVTSYFFLLQVYLANQRLPNHCCQICQHRSKGPVQHVSQVTSAWHHESKSGIKRKGGVAEGGSRTCDKLSSSLWGLSHDGSVVVFFFNTYITKILLHPDAYDVCTCSLKQNLYPWFRRHLQCISLVVITRNSIRRNRWRPRPNWRA